MKKVFLSVAIISCMSSCAVMFQGSKKDVTVKSMTPGASIYIDGEKKGTDMVTERLARKSNHTVMVKKDGFETSTTEIKKRTQVGWVLFDAFFNWFAFATDAPTGAWNTFDKDHVTVELVPTK
jgi:hypothetical protein